MTKKAVPKQLWDFGLVYESELLCRMARGSDRRTELDPELASRCYMQLIGGILRWAVETGRIDIYLEVSLLSQYQANPRLGHLEAIYHVFAYLKRHPDMGRLAYDSKCTDIDERFFHTTMLKGKNSTATSLKNSRLKCPSRGDDR
jgi:hypothetical protein